MKTYTEAAQTAHDSLIPLVDSAIASAKDRLSRFTLVIIDNKRRVSSSECQSTLAGLSSIRSEKRDCLKGGSGIFHQTQSVFSSSDKRP